LNLGDKKLFILIAAGGLVLLAGFIGVAWYLIAPRLAEFYPDLPSAVGIAAAFGFAVIAIGLLVIATSAVTGRRILFSQRITATVVRVLFPLVMLLASVFGIRKDEVKRSFIAVNNALVGAGRDTIHPGKVLLLLPHCLQATSCPYKITGGLIENCHGCGKCVIASLLVLARENGLSLAVATGGTLARRVIGETDPTAIIAVACEMDLTSGIRDSYPLPVYGVLNERPHGPCRDTTVDLSRVRGAIRFFGVRPEVRAVTGAPGEEPVTADREPEAEPPDAPEPVEAVPAADRN
jgi:hypothetical protein